MSEKKKLMKVELLAKSETTPNDLEKLSEEEKLNNTDFQELEAIEKTIEHGSVLNAILEIVRNLEGTLGGGTRDGKEGNHAFHKMQNNLKIMLAVVIAYFMIIPFCMCLISLLSNILMGQLFFKDVIERTIVESILNTLLFLSTQMVFILVIVGVFGWRILKKRKRQKDDLQI